METRKPDGYGWSLYHESADEFVESSDDIYESEELAKVNFKENSKIRAKMSNEFFARFYRLDVNPTWYKYE